MTSYGVSFMIILKEIDHVITAPHSEYNDNAYNIKQTEWPSNLQTLYDSVII